MKIGFDTLAAAGLLDEQRPLNLRDQADMAFGVGNWGKGEQRFGFMEGDPSDILARNAKRPTKGHLGDWWGSDGMGAYCARDVAYTHLLYEYQRPALREQQGLARLLKYLVLPGLAAFTEVERNGLYLDADFMGRSELSLTRFATALKGLVVDTVDPGLMAEWVERANAKTKKGAPSAPAGDVLGNEHFLRAWIFTDPRGLGLPVTKRTEKRGEPSVDAGALKDLQHPAMVKLQRLQKALKNCGFFDQWREWMCDCGRIHPYYNVLAASSERDDDSGGTVTGRRSCDKPNAQQIPRKGMMRGCIAAPPGYVFLEVDYSQLEVRIMAWLSEDETLLDVYERGGDVYIHFASIRYGIPEAEITKAQRQSAKPFVLGLIYGMQARSFRKYAHSMFGIEMTDAEAEEGHALFFRTYPGVLRFHEQQKMVVARDLQVMSPTGRIRHLVNILSLDKWERLKAERQSINSPDQGTGADMTLAAMIDMMGLGGFPEGRLLPEDEVRIVGDVHDALLFELRVDTWRENARLILQAMEVPRILTETLGVQIPVRMVAEGTVGPRWGRGKKFALETLDAVEIDEEWAA